MQGNIHTSDDWQPGTSVNRARVRVVPHSRAVTVARIPPAQNSEDLAEDLDELRRINSAGEANWTRVLSAAHDEVGNTSHAALRRLGTRSADVLLRRRRVENLAESFDINPILRGNAADCFRIRHILSLLINRLETGFLELGARRSWREAQELVRP